MPSLSRTFLALFLASSTLAIAQSTTQQDLGVVTAPHMASGLGWNIGGSEIEFQAAAAAGATHVRIESCDWQDTEGQSAPPNNISTGFSLDAECASSLRLAKKYDLQPTLLASYGSPFHQILTVSLPSGAAAGATSFPIEYVSGVGGKTLSSIVYPYDYIGAIDGTVLTYQRSYAGTLIAGVERTGNNTATVTLGQGLKFALPAGTTLQVNEVLYPSPVTASATDPSIVAFGNYAEYLAKQIKAYGLTGDVELWNEPEWFGECWDNRRNCYDLAIDPQLPGELPIRSANFGMVANLQLRTPVAGVPYVWSGPNKGYAGSVLHANMLNTSGTKFAQPQSTVTVESLHPYGNNPEDNAWLQPCLTGVARHDGPCNLVPGSGGNMVLIESANVAARQAGANYGIKHVITETGISTNTADLKHMARFVMRQYLALMADNIDYIEFYRLYQPPSAPGVANFSFITLNSNGTVFSPLPTYTAIAGLMSDLAPMKAAPVVSYTSASLPQVTSYSGTYNLDHLSIVGARPGDSANSILYTLWQRSQWQLNSTTYACQVANTTPCWGTGAQPEEADTTVTIPAGMKIDQVVNLDTRLPVSYTQSGSSITLGVSDDPIEILFIPAADGAVTGLDPKFVLGAIADQKQGSSVVANASTISKGAITYSIVSGPASISGATITATGPGSVVVKGSIAADGNYKAATATTSFNVTATTPTLSIRQVPGRTFGDAVSVTASSNSPAPISYSIVSGPATISGTTLTLTGAGTVVVGASQPSSGVYTPATATMSFTVAPKKPNLVFDAIGWQTFGTPLTVNATSASNGAVTYSVVSGPATISGTKVSFTDAGLVTLQASQAASGGFTAASAVASFHVQVQLPTLTFAPIGDTPFNTSITLRATSVSSASVFYEIVSGPANITGSTLTTKSTAGTVVVKATQAHSPGYGTVVATTSFKVVDSATPNLTIASIPLKTQGDAFNLSASSPSKGAITYSVVSGPANLSGSTVTTTGAGSVTIQAAQAASGGYRAATATATVNVISSQPLSFVYIPAKNSGDTFNLSTTSPSSGAVTYTVVSGPATISGSSCRVTGAGTVVVQAVQAASGNYKSMTAQTSFTATSKLKANLVLNPIPPRIMGDTFKIQATSSSPGAITYSIVSGPATLSGSTGTITGAVEPVVVQANQAASGEYPASSTTTTITIKLKGPQLSFDAIPAKSVGSIFPIHVTSNSPGYLKYRVVSGPAKISGNQVTVTGRGVIVLRADQDAYVGLGFGEAHVVTNLQVN